MMVYVVLMSNEMENFVDFILEHWEGLASILLSVVSIGIAICSARSTSKDASRQIASVKELGEIQAEASLLSVDLELQKIEARLRNVQEEIKDVEERLPRIAVYEMMQKSRGENPTQSIHLSRRKSELENEINYLSDLQLRFSNVRERMMKNRKEEDTI